jgi:hypothetical protein
VVSMAQGSSGLRLPCIAKPGRRRSRLRHGVVRGWCQGAPKELIPAAHLSVSETRLIRQVLSASVRQEPVVHKELRPQRPGVALNHLVG